MKRCLKIATRNSPLALWQANFVKSQLLAHTDSISIELLPIVTSGDKFLNANLQALGGKGLFVKELEQALISKEADLAVHSMKDVPIQQPDGLAIVAVLARHSPWDVLVSPHNLNTLPQGAKVGTTSLRRKTQLLLTRNDLSIEPLRGNVQTRLQKLDEGQFDAIVLAEAGLTRLGLQKRIQTRLDKDPFLPACGQGAIGIETRSDDEALIESLKKLNHFETAKCVATERKVNQALGGNCYSPLAVYCEAMDNTRLKITARLISRGLQMIQTTEVGLFDHSDLLADACVQNLIDQGAWDYLASYHHAD